MSDKVFAQGLYVKPPNENAPAYVKFKLNLKRQEVMEWLNSQTDEWVNLEIKEAQSGKWYAEVNTWKPNNNQVAFKAPQAAVAPKTDDFEDDIPFS